jgi:hypothetical protein
MNGRIIILSSPRSWHSHHLLVIILYCVLCSVPLIPSMLTDRRITHIITPNTSTVTDRPPYVPTPAASAAGRPGVGSSSLRANC